MSLLDFFFSPSAQKLEQKGDSFYKAGCWGQAKQAYEKALDKLETTSGVVHDRIMGKLVHAQEALAQEHERNAENYLEGGFFKEAQELLRLALEITSDRQFKKKLKETLKEINLRQRQSHLENSVDYVYGLEDFFGEDKNGMRDTSIEPSEDEEFVAMCNTLPDEVCAAYKTYGQHFKIGYVALNHGDFQTAIDHLQLALADNPQPESYIPLELATAYLNLDQTEEAQTLLENFVILHPEALPAYQLLCEIYWEQKDFSKVETLLTSIPLELQDTLAVALLKGETLYQSGQYEKAKRFYQDFLNTYGMQGAIAFKLAETCERLGEQDTSRIIYREIIGNCTGCKTGIDPEIRDKYAELSFAAGIYNTEILEIYLSLAGEIPENAARYFDRISRIYEAQGNAHEAARFRAFSDRAKSRFIGMTGK